MSWPAGRSNVPTAARRLPLPAGSDTATLPPLPPTADAATLPPQTEPAPAATASPVAVPGYEILASWAAAAWASSTRPGRWSSARRRPEDDPVRAATPARRTWRASAPRRRPSPACSIPTSCRSTRSASTTACPSSRWSSAAAAAWTRSSTARRCRRRRRRALVETLARAMQAAHEQGHHPPRPQAGQRAAGGGRHAEDHRLRPGQEARRRPARPQSGAIMGTPIVHGPGAGRRQVAGDRPGGATSTRWGPSSTSA